MQSRIKRSRFIKKLQIIRDNVDEVNVTCANCGNAYCKGQTYDKGLVDEKDAIYIANRCTGYVLEKKNK